MSLKFVIAVRHGEYRGSRLTPNGEETIRSLADQISSLTNGSKVMIFTSPAHRAVQTSEIIKNKLSVAEATLCDSLYGDRYNDGEEQMKQVLEFVGDNDPDVIIMVTHYEAPAGIIDAFSKKHLDEPAIGHYVDMNKGSAIVFGFSSRQVQYIYG